jgi:tetratricopeptide (TPR) repeat protein
MKDRVKRNIFDALFVAGMLFIAVAIFLGFSLAVVERNKRLKDTAFDSAAMKRYMMTEDYKKGREQSNIMDQASFLENREKFEQAIEMYKNALTVRNSGGYIGMIHNGLGRCYEKTGQYELALKEIEWLISRQPKTAVLNDLAVSKKRIEELMQQQADKK